MKEYRLQYLNDRQFEALSVINPRYKNTKDDLGFADMRTNRIFVRKTGNSVIDQFITNHEIEEILAKNSSHQDEFNIRHKKGGALRTFLPIAAAFIPGIGPPLAAALNIGLNQYAQKRHPEQLGKPSVGSALMQGASAYFGGKAAGGITQGAMAGGKAAGAGFLSKAAGIASGAGKGLMSTLGFGAPSGLDVGGKIAAPTMREGFNAMQATNPTLSSPIKFGGANYLVSGGAKGLSAMPGSAMSPLTSGLGFSPSATPSPTTMPDVNTALPSSLPGQIKAPTMKGGLSDSFNLESPISSANQANTATSILPTGTGEISKQTITKTPILRKLLGDKWEQVLLGASIPLVANMFSQPMFPPGSENVPFTPEQSQLFQETANMVRQGANVQLNPAQQKAITVNFDDALQQARQNIQDRYKALRPGSDIENDSQFREAMIELESDFAEKKANALAGAQLGLGTQQTQMMAELANMEVGNLAMRAGIQYQEAKDFKDMLAQAGFLVATSGQPIVYSR